MDMKICDECKINLANIHLTQIVDDEVSVSHLCEKCAQSKGISIVIEQVSEGEVALPESIPGKVLQNIVKKTPEKEKDLLCTNCGMTLSDFREKGWLGCASCYASFEKEIESLLVQVHGDSNHKGKIYETDVSKRDKKINERSLRTELDNAIKSEEFELAAIIRDKINNLSVSRMADEELK